MATILFSSILRNRVRQLQTWHRQLSELSALLRADGHVCYLSAFENDSIDGTKLFHHLDFSAFNNYFSCSAGLKTQYYGSVVDEQRVINLAFARRQTLLQFPLLAEVHFVVSVEPDVTYDVAGAKSCIDQAMREEWDILSGVSFQGDSQTLYDTWATRRTESEDCWSGGEIPNGTLQVWSTYNCLCVYNAQGFHAGANFGGFNDRLGTFDCDTVVVCEEFRKRGFSRVALHGGFAARHYT